MGRQVCRFRKVINPSLIPIGLSFPFHRFLHQIKTTTNDKIVLISNYTQTLDLFEKLCRSKKCVTSNSSLNFLYIVRQVWIFPFRWDHDDHEAPKTRRSI